MRSRLFRRLASGAFAAVALVAATATPSHALVACPGTASLADYIGVPSFTCSLGGFTLSNFSFDSFFPNGSGADVEVTNVDPAAVTITAFGPTPGDPTNAFGFRFDGFRIAMDLPKTTDRGDATESNLLSFLNFDLRATGGRTLTGASATGSMLVDTGDRPKQIDVVALQNVLVWEPDGGATCFAYEADHDKAGTYPLSRTGSCPKRTRITKLATTLSLQTQIGRGSGRGEINGHVESSVDGITFYATRPTVTATPEPATLALCGGGLVLLAAVRRRRFEVAAE